MCFLLHFQYYTLFYIFNLFPIFSENFFENLIFICCFKKCAPIFLNSGPETRVWLLFVNETSTFFTNSTIDWKKTSVFYLLTIYDANLNPSLSPSAWQRAKLHPLHFFPSPLAPPTGRPRRQGLSAEPQHVFSVLISSPWWLRLLFSSQVCLILLICSETPRRSNGPSFWHLMWKLWAEKDFLFCCLL